jgi:hypothetical protein
MSSLPYRCNQLDKEVEGRKEERKVREGKTEGS